MKAWSLVLKETVLLEGKTDKYVRKLISDGNEAVKIIKKYVR